MKKEKIDILIPAFNESKIIARTIKNCLKLSTNFRPRIVVIVDGKTTDDTSSIAKKAGAFVVETNERRGKGALFRKSLKYVQSPYVVQIDADHQFQPSDINKLVQPLIDGYQVTLGTRYEKGAIVEKGSVSLLKKIGSYTLSFATSVISGRRVTDVMAGFKGFRKAALLSLHPQVNHFGYEAELVIKAAKKQYKIRNVPITYTARKTGNSSVNSIKHGFLVLGTILKVGLKN